MKSVYFLLAFLLDSAVLAAENPRTSSQLWQMISAMAVSLTPAMAAPPSRRRTLTHIDQLAAEGIRFTSGYQFCKRPILQRDRPFVENFLAILD